MTVPISVSLNHYLVVAGLLFCIGLYGALARRNAVVILMGIELMLNAVNLNLVAFSRYITPQAITGQVWAVFIITIAAAANARAAPDWAALRPRAPRPVRRGGPLGRVRPRCRRGR